MKTIRHNVFETNSSSCHVMTIMSAKEKELVDNRQAIVYAHSKSEDMPNIAEIFDFTKFSNKMKEIFKDNYNDKIEFINELWNNILVNLKAHDSISYSAFDNIADKYKIEGTEYGDIEDFMYCCCHEEENAYCVENAVETTINGKNILIASWEACC